MCIICVQYNLSKDAWDALDMVEAAGREPNSIAPDHLVRIKNELMKRSAEDKTDLTLE